MSKVVAAAIGSLVMVTAVVARGEPPAGAASCSGCHPSSARVTSPVSRLVGLAPDAIVRALKEFRSGRRAGTVMDRIAKGFTDEEMQAIAAWYAGRR